MNVVRVIGCLSGIGLARNESIDSHSTICPLCFFHDVETGVDDELVHVLRCVWEAEAGYAIPAAFGSAEGNVEYGGVGR